MIIKFTEVVWSGEWDFRRIVRDSGYAHQVDADKLIEKVWDGSTRELILNCEIDTETGIITAVSDDA